MLLSAWGAFKNTWQTFSLNSAFEWVTFVDMNRPHWKKIPRTIVGISVLLLTGLLCVWLVRKNVSASRTDTDVYAEKVNLSLRRTAHYLLAEAGDSSSRIAPVQQQDAQTWLLQLEHAFNYDHLPELLQQSLEIHGIHDNYDVAVLNCSDGTLELGYNFIDFKQNNSAPCGGREMQHDCYNLQVRFIPATIRTENIVLGWILAAGGVLTGIFFTARGRWKPQSGPAIKTDITDSNQVVFGQSRLDAGNLVLLSGSAKHQLTYREAKLLHLFASHPNQLLERDQILQSVWGDEGIIVGRSLDVFVSRLRKLLRDDPGVRIVAVHGIGYRLEIEVRSEK
jgi:DNA-binding winged helix-turn-helix (wHTH) protein